jgi:hypothetical protein
MSWQLLALAGVGLWLLLAVVAVACAVAAGRADARDELAGLQARLDPERSPWPPPLAADADDVLDTLARELATRAPSAADPRPESVAIRHRTRAA